MSGYFSSISIPSWNSKSNNSSKSSKTKEQIKKEQDDDLNEKPEVAFQNLVARYARNVKDTKEYAKRKTQFENNFNKIKSFNDKKNNKTVKEKFKLGINELADWAPEEIAAILTFKPEVDRPLNGNATFPPTSKRFLQTTNTSIDWIN